MKKQLFFAAATLAALQLTMSCNQGKTTASEPDAKEYEIVTYVYNGDTVMPNPDYVTTINYAFANVSETFDSIHVNNPERLRKLVALKEQNPKLKVLLSLGGTCPQFSPMAADSLKRMSFAADTRRVIDEYALDGIDFDWEFPCGQGGTPDDYKNYNKLLRLVRQNIGDDKLMTIAAGGDMAGLDTTNIPELMQLFDYVNVMAYDLGGQAPWHHTALYRSEHTGWRSVDETVNDYIAHGVPYDKMMLGLGFYGRGDDNYYSGWTSSDGAQPYGEDLTLQWDSIACVPYTADKDGNLVCGFEDPKSIKIKCDYLKDKGFRGAMSWRTETDYKDQRLARTVAEELLNKKTAE